jgi:RNA polymerase sigma-70 factor (ECF subfamily)
VLDPSTDITRQREVVDVFLAASRSGNFDALVAVLHPDVVLHADAAGVAMGAPEELVGASAVAGSFSGRAKAAQPALIDGEPGVVWAPRGRPKVVWDLTIVNGRIADIFMIAATETLDDLDVVIYEG